MTLPELDKLQVIEPDEDMIAHIKDLVSRGDMAHVELHLSALENEYRSLDTTAVRNSL